MTGVTTTVDGCMIVFCHGAGDDNLPGAFSASPGSPNTRYSGTTTLGNDGDIVGGDYLKTTAGATGNITATRGAPETQANIVLALLPTASGGTPQPIILFIG